MLQSAAVKLQYSCSKVQYGCSTVKLRSYYHNNARLQILQCSSLLCGLFDAALSGSWVSGQLL